MISKCLLTHVESLLIDGIIYGERKILYSYMFINYMWGVLSSVMKHLYGRMRWLRYDDCMSSVELSLHLMKKLVQQMDLPSIPHCIYKIRLVRPYWKDVIYSSVDSEVTNAGVIFFFTEARLEIVSIKRRIA